MDEPTPIHLPSNFDGDFIAHPEKEDRGYILCETSDLTDIFSKYLRGRKFVDLGAGDGRVVMKAMVYGAIAYGIEIHKEYIDKSQAKRKMLHADMFKCDWSKYDIIFYYSNSSFNEQVMEKLQRECQGKTLILYTRYVEETAETFKNLKLIEESRHVKVYKI